MKIVLFQKRVELWNIMRNQKKRQLSQGEKDKLKEDLEKIKEKLQDELDETEINIINHTIDDLGKDLEENKKL